MGFKKILFFLFSFFFIFNLSPIVQSTEPGSTVDVYFFWGIGCPHCENQKVFLVDLVEKYPEVVVRDFEVYRSRENLELLQKTARAYEVDVHGIPMTFIGNRAIAGFDGVHTTGRDIENEVKKCLAQGCPSPEEKIADLTRPIEGIIAHPQDKNDPAPDDALFELNLFGRNISISTRSSLPWLAAGLGLVDGINPCTLSVLFFLLTYLLAIGSRKKAVKVGLIFTLTVFLVYLVFMLGILNLITLIGAIYQIRIFVAIIALIAGLIMLKDFFYYGRWVSLEIPSRAKPIIKRLIQKGTISSAIVLGVLATLVEIPCTSGIPLVYTTILAQQQIVGFSAILYLAAYNFFFILPLLLVVGMVAFVLLKIEDAEAWRLKFRKQMRLFSGLILLFLGVALLMGWI